MGNLVARTFWLGFVAGTKRTVFDIFSMRPNTLWLSAMCSVGSMDGREDAGEQITADSHLGQLERDGAGMANDARLRSLTFAQSTVNVTGVAFYLGKVGRCITAKQRQKEQYESDARQ